MSDFETNQGYDVFDGIDHKSVAQHALVVADFDLDPEAAMRNLIKAYGSETDMGAELIERIACMSDISGHHNQHNVQNCYFAGSMIALTMLDEIARRKELLPIDCYARLMTERGLLPQEPMTINEMLAQCERASSASLWYEYAEIIERVGTKLVSSREGLAVFSGGFVSMLEIGKGAIAAVLEEKITEITADTTVDWNEPERWF